MDKGHNFSSTGCVCKLPGFKADVMFTSPVVLTESTGM